MNGPLERKNSVETMGDAFEWLRRNPVLVLAFFVVGIVESLGEEVVALSMLGFVLLVVADGIAHRFAYAEARGDGTTIGAEVGPVLGRLLSLLGAWIVYAILIVIGLVFLILPGIYLGLRLSLAFPAIVIDDERAVEGLSTSWDAARGNLLKLLGISLLAVIVTFSTLIVAALFSVLFDSLAVLALISAVVTAILSPIVQMAYARVYLENRENRAEGAVTVDDGWTGDDREASEADDAWGHEDGWDAESDDRDDTHW